MQVEIWSDVVCPWCYIGKRRFEAALAAFEHAAEVEVVWRSFELDPGAPRVREGDLVGHLAVKYRFSQERAREAIASMSEQAAGEGLEYHLESARGGNTFDAHRLIHLAAERGLQDQIKEAFLRAYQCDGVAIGDRDAVAAVAVKAGLDAEEVAAVLDGDAYGAQVRADEQEGAALGITGVPFFVLGRRYGVSGAQPAAVLLDALRQAWRETRPLSMVSAGGSDETQAGSCQDGSCTF